MKALQIDKRSLKYEVMQVFIFEYILQLFVMDQLEPNQ